MARLSKEGIIELMMVNICESKNVNYYLKRNYFVNIYCKIDGYYDKFVECAKNLFSVHGYSEDEVIPEIEKYFRMGAYA